MLCFSLCDTHALVASSPAFFPSEASNVRTNLQKPLAQLTHPAEEILSPTSRDNDAPNLAGDLERTS
jgi:hypothetical protein